MNIAKILGLTISSSLTIVAHTASAQVISPGWSATSTIADLRVYNGEAVFGQMTELTSIVTCTNTSTDSSNTFRVENGIALFSETYSILLTAAATGQPVQVYTTGLCSGGAAVINGARLKG